MKNKLVLTSMTTIAGLYGVLMLFLIIIFKIIGWPLSNLLLFSIIFLIVQFLIAPLLMDIVMKLFYHVNFNVNMPDYLKEYIEQVCKTNNMKYPKIGYINDGSPNAFTYGRTKNDARIILTQGVFDLLTPEEVKTVVSHELGHAVHYDMFLMTAAQIIPLVLYYIYDITVSSASDSDEDASSLAIIGLAAYVLYIISEYVILWFSRTREYYADEFAIEATCNPNALASALVKIGYGLTTTNKKQNDEVTEDATKKKKTINTKKSHMNSVAALGIFDSKASKALVVNSYDNGNISKNKIKKAARWELWNPWAKWYEFNSTHPMISKRIKAICNYCDKYNQPKFISFDEVQPESYVDDFAVELLINFLPLMSIFVMLILTPLFMKVLPNPISIIGIGIIVFSSTILLSYSRSHKNRAYKDYKISELLSEVKVSGITCIPCVISGEIIGRGDPGYIFSEDFVIRDETGIIFLDYNQPLAIINKFFALLKSKKYMGKNVVIKGWYKRAPIPYIEIYTMTVDGKVKKCHSYGFTKGMIYMLLAIGIFITLVTLV